MIKIHNAENWLGFDNDVGGGDFGDVAAPLAAVIPEDETVMAASDGNVCSKSSAASNVPEYSIHQRDATEAASADTDQTHPLFDPSKLTSDPHCFECKFKFRDPKPQDLVMFLHALSYSGSGWKFSTDLPDWAKDSWVDPPSYMDIRF